MEVSAVFPVLDRRGIKKHDFHGRVRNECRKRGKMNSKARKPGITRTAHAPRNKPEINGLSPLGFVPRPLHFARDDKPGFGFFVVFPTISTQ